MGKIQIENWTKSNKIRNLIRLKKNLYIQVFDPDWSNTPIRITLILTLNFVPLPVPTP